MERHCEKQSTTRYYYLGLIQMPDVERLCTLSLQTPGAPNLRDKTSASASKQVASRPGVLGAWEASRTHQVSHLASLKDEAKPQQAVVPVLFGDAEILPATHQAAEGRGDAAVRGLADGSPLLRCRRRAAAGTQCVLQLDCTAAGVWQAAGCLGTC